MSPVNVTECTHKKPFIIPDNTSCILGCWQKKMQPWKKLQNSRKIQLKHPNSIRITRWIWIVNCKSKQEGGIGIKWTANLMKSYVYVVKIMSKVYTQPAVYMSTLHTVQTTCMSPYTTPGIPMTPHQNIPFNTQFHRLGSFLLKFNLQQLIYITGTWQSAN